MTNCIIIQLTCNTKFKEVELKADLLCACKSDTYCLGLNRIGGILNF